MKKLCRFLHMETLTPATVLLMGLISLAAGGAWLLYVRYALEARGDLSYLAVCREGLSELVYGTVLHLAAAGILALDQKGKQTPSS